MDCSKKISVIMAAYNCESTVADSIESILNQTYDNIEFIICDDCSSDKTYEILKKYKEKYPDKIILLRNEENKKLPATLNKCLQYITGDYVARMDADDLSKPKRFEKQVEFLQTHPEYDLVSTVIEISDGKKITGTIIREEYPEKMTLVRSGAFSHATIMTYPYVYEKLNGYSLDKYAVRVEDLDLWFRFFNAGFKGYGLQEILYTVLEDGNTYDRRAFRYRINSAVTRLRGFKLLGIPKRYWLGAFRTVIIGLIPSPVYKLLHKKKHG